jgi:aryl-alcohol dehydrogenase-like predicted oxidoreductase
MGKVMKYNNKYSISRRMFLKNSALVSGGLLFAPHLNFGSINISKPLKREFGRLNFEVTTLGLGGQASLQWTPQDVDPVKIILKAFQSGINYFDTSNVYGPSQLNYGKAFQKLNLIPGLPGYNESLRNSIFLTSKTGLRWAKGGWDKEGIHMFTNGDKDSRTIDDLKRTLTQVFGDGKGNYPPGSYIDMVLIHSLNTMVEIDTLYEGLDNPNPAAEHIGALAALLDYRDGTNYTGLNPGEEKLIRHIGFSGHYSAAVMMEMIQRDEKNIIDAMLVAINTNDRLNFNMQHNVIPVAASKNMGIIGMKVFADGAMYSKEARWSHKPEDVVRTVGSKALPSRPLVEYTLTTPGVHTAIIGIGHIDDDPNKCQLQQNLSSAQIAPLGLSDSDRREIESMTRSVKEGKTNYFQDPLGKLTPAREILTRQEIKNRERIVRLSWQTAYAGEEPIQRYEIWRDNNKISQMDHHAQINKNPFTFEDKIRDKDAHHYKIITVDRIGSGASSEDLVIPAIG